MHTHTHTMCCIWSCSNYSAFTQACYTLCVCAEWKLFLDFALNSHIFSLCITKRKKIKIVCIFSFVFWINCKCICVSGNGSERDRWQQVMRSNPSFTSKQNKLGTHVHISHILFILIHLMVMMRFGINMAEWLIKEFEEPLEPVECKSN